VSADGTTSERRLVALREKLQCLAREVETWTALPAQNPAFRPHASQLAAVCATIDAMHGMIRERIQKIVVEARLSTESFTSLERLILGAIQVWDCYRVKFVARFSASVQPSLALTDDLAHEAYRLARDRAVMSGAISELQAREPPLVFLTPQWSPYARARARGYELDESTGNQSALSELEEWLAAMPVPLIALPSYQTTHLPEAVFIGHEVGHLVEEELGLDDELAAAIKAQLRSPVAERTEAWTHHWRSEVFADIYGVLVSGPAYAAMLLDILAADDPEVIANEAQPLPTTSFRRWSEYPPRALRARLVCEAVRQLRNDKKGPRFFSSRAAQLEEEWTRLHTKNAMGAYVLDIPNVVRGVLRTPLTAFRSSSNAAGATLADTIQFSPAMQREAEADARAALDREPLCAKELRSSFAALTLAFRDSPQRYLDNHVQRRFLDYLEMRRSRERRSFDPNGLKAVSIQTRAQSAAREVLGRIERSTYRPGA
jgi:hypothetical protein